MGPAQEGMVGWRRALALAAPAGLGWRPGAARSGRRKRVPHGPPAAPPWHHEGSRHEAAMSIIRLPPVAVPVLVRRQSHPDVNVVGAPVLFVRGNDTGTTKPTIDVVIKDPWDQSIAWLISSGGSFLESQLIERLHFDLPGQLGQRLSSAAIDYQESDFLDRLLHNAGQPLTSRQIAELLMPILHGIRRGSLVLASLAWPPTPRPMYVAFAPETIGLWDLRLGEDRAELRDGSGGPRHSLRVFTSSEWQTMARMSYRLPLPSSVGSDAEMASIIPNGFRLLTLRGGQVLAFDRPEIYERPVQGPQKPATPKQILSFLKPHMEREAKAGRPATEAAARRATEEWIEREFDGRLVIRRDQWRSAFGEIDKVLKVPLGRAPGKSAKPDALES